MGKQGDAPKSVSDMFTSTSAMLMYVAGPQRHSPDAGQLHWLGIAYDWGDVEAAMHELFVTPPSGTHLNCPPVQRSLATCNLANPGMWSAPISHPAKVLRNFPGDILSLLASSLLDF